MHGPATSNFYGAYACDMNVFLQSHKDNDFKYSAVSLHMGTLYLLNECPVIHFSFSRLCIAIPLRPGDVLFFNPKEHHCILSISRTDNNVYCLSLYSKSVTIGLNNNVTPLTPSDAIYYCTQWWTAFFSGLLTFQAIHW